MAQVTSYEEFIVESFRPDSTAGLHGDVHIRPLPGQGLLETMFVACSKTLAADYPVGTLFKIRARVTDREGSRPYLYSNYNWPVQVVSAKQARAHIDSLAPLRDKRSERL